MADNPVMVVMARNNVFPWQTSTSFPANLWHSPSGPGDDCFHFVVDGVGTVRINGNSPEFVACYTREADR